MINTICIIALILFSLLIRGKSKQNYLPFGILCPLSISAQNTTSGGGNSEIIFWLFVLGFLVSLMPERKKPFEKKAMTVVKITILGILAPLSMSAQSKEILEGRVLPNFNSAIEWDVNQKLKGALEGKPYLPLLDACHFGNYKAQWFFYQNDTLYKFGNPFSMFCWSKEKLPNVPVSDSERELFSKSWQANADGRWYAVISGVDCGYVYTYQVEGTVFAWRLEQLTCK